VRNGAHAQSNCPFTKGVADAFQAGELVTASPRVEFLINGDYLVLSVSVTYSRAGIEEKTTRHYASQLCAGVASSCQHLQSQVAKKLDRDLKEFAVRGIYVVAANGEPFAVQHLTKLIDV